MFPFAPRFGGRGVAILFPGALRAQRFPPIPMSVMKGSAVGAAPGGAGGGVKEERIESGENVEGSTRSLARYEQIVRPWTLDLGDPLEAGA
ncbi:hypothetical protein NDU88_000471 [Pleurodeles waltl]|uniref:Uncharacterized protein n=1 Tax=Pleurodeles waltl TaxID=8319 RepID=A0AAV7V8G5_PLEWA|nr:hypothetical protein NDU88_000471 [Pleurodeles waltl]